MEATPVLKEEIKLLEDSGYHLVTINKQVFLQDECCRCEDCGEWFSESFSCDNGLCDDCDEEAIEGRAISFTVDVARGK